jgi:Tfp pilus assembly protein PilF
LHKLITADAGAIKPRIALSYTYLQEGRQWEAAERSLRDILAIAPNHSEAQHNLALVLEKKASQRSRELSLENG